MSENNEAYRCKVCGGRLIADDESFGFSKCRNCGNKYRLTAQEIRYLKENAPKKKDTSIFISMTKQDVEREAKLRKTNNAIYALKGFMALIALSILGLFAYLISMYLQGGILMDTLEIFVVSLIGLGVPVLITLFAKLYKNKKESLILNIIMAFLFLCMLAAILYFSLPRYFIGIE